MRVGDQPRGRRRGGDAGEGAEAGRPVSPWPHRALPVLLLGFGAVQILLGIGLWLFPDTFFEEIGPYGVQNDHYMGDLATFYLALGAASLVAVVRPAWRVPVLVLSALQYSLHSVNHLIDVGDADSTWQGVTNLILLAATTALLVWMLRVNRR